MYRPSHAYRSRVLPRRCASGLPGCAEQTEVANMAAKVSRQATLAKSVRRATVLMRPPEFMNRDTNSSAVTSDCTKGTGFPSTDGGKPGTLLPCRRCSIHGRRCKTSGRLCAATNHKADIECEVLPARGTGPAQARDPKYPWTSQIVASILQLRCLVARYDGRFLLQHTNELTHPRRVVRPGSRRNHHAVDHRI